MERERSTLTINDALAELANIEGQIRATGAVDSEPELLNIIRNKLTKGDISPIEAINQGRNMLQGRQDYH